MIKHFSMWFALLYLLPVLVAAGLWFLEARPTSWRTADWGSSGQLAREGVTSEADIRVYAARAGRLKGIVAVHSWIVVKPAGSTQYERFEVVGWGNPVRRNAYAPDARWYSNEPHLLKRISGDAAQALIPDIARAVQSYPYANRGSYRAWPGPNSNTFVSHVIAQVPQIGAVLPPTAVGKDFPVGGDVVDLSDDGIRLSINGIVSLSLGLRQGLELNLLGLVAGIDVLRPAVKLPGLGRIGMSPAQ